MTGLVEYLQARIAEDEAAARAATEDPGMASEWRETTSGCLDVGVPDHGGADWHDYVWPQGDSRVTRHIARWDPARVLAECAAKRAILRRIEVEFNMRHEVDWAAGMNILQDLAQPYAGRPDFRDEWRLG